MEAKPLICSLYGAREEKIFKKVIIYTFAVLIWCERRKTFFNLYSKTLFVSSVGARKKKFIIFLDFVFKQTVAVEC